LKNFEDKLSIIIPKIIIIYDGLFEKGLTKKYYFVTLNLFQGLFLIYNYKFRCRNEFGMTLFGQPQIRLSKNVEKQPED